MFCKVQPHALKISFHLYDKFFSMTANIGKKHIITNLVSIAHTTNEPTYDGSDMLSTIFPKR